MKISPAKIEKAAKAMCNAAWAQDGEGWNDAGDEQKDMFRLEARAAAIAFGLEVEE